MSVKFEDCDHSSYYISDELPDEIIAFCLKCKARLRWTLSDVEEVEDESDE